MSQYDRQTQLWNNSVVILHINADWYLIREKLFHHGSLEKQGLLQK